MDHSAIGADDHRVIGYARLVDPAAWSDSEIPEINPVTAPRLRFSLEAGYRIACHEGGVADPTDVVERICLDIGLSGAVPGLQLLPGIDAEQLASFAAILTGDEDEPADGPDVLPAEAGLPAEARSEEDDDEVPLRREPPSHAGPENNGSGGENLPVDEDEDEPDPDHDPEAGISHVGDADEGQYHEEG